MALAVALAALGLLVAGGLVYWTQTAYEPGSTAASAMERAVEREGWYEFVPEAGAGEVGVVLYPGAKVSAEAYAETARRLSEASRARVAVIRSPLYFALLDRDAAEAVIRTHPDTERWVVGGHSLGGVAAAGFAARDREVSGLLLWASYPASGTDLGDRPLKTASIYGSRDEVLDRQSLDDARERLPEDTEYVELAGANHAQFGDYGEQGGDGSATTSDDEALSETVAASARLVQDLGVE